MKTKKVVGIYLMKSSFKRDEMKYLITQKQFEELLPFLKSNLQLDEYCESIDGYKVYNLYFDTPNNLVITKSIMKPKFKEKLRIRNYDEPNKYYLELKKKCKGVVFKRRIRLTRKEADDFIKTKVIPEREEYLDKVIVEELNNFLKLYPNLEASMEISYQRRAFINKKNEHFLRITIDNQLKSHYYNKDNPERMIIPSDMYLMEIKILGSMPLWLARTLNTYRIYPTSFSKYGKDFRGRLKEVQNV